MGALISAIFLGVLLNSYAGEATQTDWSGGPGVLGPVANWQNSFYTRLSAECYLHPGMLQLDSKPYKSIVEPNFDAAWSTYAADLDSDGDLDVLGAARNGDQFACWLNLDGTGTSWQKISLGYLDGPESVIADDFDGDGDLDVAGAASNTGRINIWLNIDGSGTSWFSRIVSSGIDGASCVYSSDIDGDGDIDLFSCSMELHLLCWFENADGAGTAWITHIVDDYCYGIQSVCGADVDGDGDEDVFGARWSHGHISWWENTNGTGIDWEEHYIDEDFAEASEVCSCDMDGDGDIDVLATSVAEHKVRWWENADGAGGSWFSHDVCEYQYKAYTVDVSDIDDDGDYDVVVGGRGNNCVFWYDNFAGPGLVWNAHLIDSEGSDPSSVVAADINTDGSIDILTAAIDSDEISWWNLACYPRTGYATSSILNMQEEPQWLAVDWSGEEPPGTETVFQFRTGKHPLNLGYWTDYVYEPCDLCDIVSAGDTLFQYRVRFFTDDSSVTPLLDEFLVSWDPNGLSQGESISSLNAISPNPVAGGSVFSVSFSLAEESEVELIIFNLMGRSVDSCASVFPAGETAVEFPAPNSGIYIVRMNSESLHYTRRLAVL